MTITALFLTSEGSDLSALLIALIVIGAVLVFAAIGHAVQTLARRPRGTPPSEALARRH